MHPCHCGIDLHENARLPEVFDAADLLRPDKNMGKRSTPLRRRTIHPSMPRSRRRLLFDQDTARRSLAPRLGHRTEAQPPHRVQTVIRIGTTCVRGVVAPQVRYWTTRVGLAPSLILRKPTQLAAIDLLGGVVAVRLGRSAKSPGIRPRAGPAQSRRARAQLSIAGRQPGRQPRQMALRHPGQCTTARRDFGIELKRNLDKGIGTGAEDPRVAGRVGLSTPAQLVAAATAARRAQPIWAATDLSYRLNFACRERSRQITCR